MERFAHLGLYSSYTLYSLLQICTWDSTVPFVHIKGGFAILNLIGTTWKTRLYGMTAWPHSSPSPPVCPFRPIQLASTTDTIPSPWKHKCSIEIQLVCTLLSGNTWFQPTRRVFGDICPVFSFGNLPQRAPLIASASDSPLRSSHLVSHRSLNTIS